MKVSPRAANADAFEDSLRPPDASLKASRLPSLTTSPTPRFESASGKR